MKEYYDLSKIANGQSLLLANISHLTQYLKILYAHVQMTLAIKSS